MAIIASDILTISSVSDGDDGAGIASTKVEYQAGSSGTSAPTGTWSTSIPATSASAPYLWTRVTYTYTDGSTPKVVYSVGSTPEGIVVGGRNLVRNSDVLDNKFSTVGGYAGTRTIVADAEAKSGKHIEFKCTTAGMGLYTSIFPKTTDKVGKVYTWSFWAKSSVDKSGSIGHECGGQTSVSLTTSWKKFTHTWTFTDDTHHSFTWYLNWEVDEILYIRDFKIEEGNKATDWTPAPEDVDSKIEEAQTTASKAQLNIDSANARIDTLVSRTDSLGQSLTSVTQTADKINWLVKSGTSSSNFTLTDRTAQLITDSLVIKDSTGASTIISGGKMDIKQIFAQDITATGKIRSLEIIGATGSFTGNVTANTLTCSSGTIGGWNISSDGIYKITGTKGVYVLNGTDSSNNYLVVNELNSDGSWKSSPFFVRSTGQMYAANATIKGNITATSGKIGSFNINSSLYTNSNTLNYTGSDSNIYLGSDGIGFGKSYLTSGGGAVFSGYDGTNSDIGGNTIHLWAKTDTSDNAAIELYGGSGANSTAYIKSRGTIFCNGEIQSEMSVGKCQFRAVKDNYGFMIRNDGSYTYFLLTNSSDAYGSWNSYRPLTINNSTGDAVLKGTATESVYPQGFFDQRPSQNWGNQDGTFVTGWGTANGGVVAFRENGAKANVIIDGFFYQDEGKYKVLDTNNYTSYAPTKTGSGASGSWGISITGNAATATKVGNDLSVNGKTYNGSSAVTVGTIGIGYGGTGGTTAAAARENLKAMGSVTANGYEGMARRDGNTSDWIRTTSNGIIPYQSGSRGGGHCSIGTSTWYFSTAYIDTISCNNINTYSGDHRPIGSIDTNGQRVSGFGATSTTVLKAYGQWGTSGASYSAKNITVSASDVRLKTNIVDASIQALDTINRIKMREFDWTDHEEHQKIGMVADELESIDSRFAVGGGYDDEGYFNTKCVDTFYMMGYVVKGIQEICSADNERDEKIQSNEARVNTLQTQLNEAMNQIAELKKLVELLTA